MYSSGALLTCGTLKSLEDRCRLVTLAVFLEQRGAEYVPRWKFARGEMLELGGIPLLRVICELKEQLFSPHIRGDAIGFQQWRKLGEVGSAVSAIGPCERADSGRERHAQAVRGPAQRGDLQGLCAVFVAFGLAQYAAFVAIGLTFLALSLKVRAPVLAVLLAPRFVAGQFLCAVRLSLPSPSLVARPVASAWATGVPRLCGAVGTVLARTVDGS